MSAAKLLVIAIDSVGFVEYGDIQDENTFIKWLNTYAKLNSIGITVGSSGSQVIRKINVPVGRASCPRRLEACTTRKVVNIGLMNISKTKIGMKKNGRCDIRSYAYCLQRDVKAALEDLQRAIDLDGSLRERAKTNAAFDNIRQDR